MQTLEEALPILFLHCKQSSLPPSLPPFLFKTVAPPQSSNNIPPNTNTKPKQNQTHSFFLPPSLQNTKLPLKLQSLATTPLTQQQQQQQK